MAKKKSLAKVLKGFTPKQATFFIWYAMTGNGTRAALRAYYPKFPIDKEFIKLTEEERRQYVTADAIARTNLEKHRNPLSLYMEQNGLDLKKALSKLQEGLEATKTSNAAILLTKDGKTVKAEEQGIIEVPDYPEQREWWDRLMKLLGKDMSDNSPPLVIDNRKQYVVNLPERGNMDTPPKTEGSIKTA